MHQWCHDHTGNVEMSTTMFYIIFLVANVTIPHICYTMCCSVFLHRSNNSVIWFTQKQLGILYYQVFISDVKWCGVEYV